MLTPREKALEILGLPKGSNPNQNEILGVQRELKLELLKKINKKLEGTKDEEGQRLILEEEKREVNRIESAVLFFSGNFQEKLSYLVIAL